MKLRAGSFITGEKLREAAAGPEVRHRLMNRTVRSYRGQILPQSAQARAVNRFVI